MDGNQDLWRLGVFLILSPLYRYFFLRHISRFLSDELGAAYLG